MSRKRKSPDDSHDGQDGKQRQRMTHYHQNCIYQTTQQKLYDGSKNFFRKLKEPLTNHGPSSPSCSSMHCPNSHLSICDYCEKEFCSNHLIQCAQCNKTYCLYCSTNINNQFSICLTCLQNE